MLTIRLRCQPSNWVAGDAPWVRRTGGLTSSGTTLQLRHAGAPKESELRPSRTIAILASLAAAVLAPASVAQERACPSGASRDWAWEIRDSTLFVENPDLAFTWNTANGSVPGQGLRITLSMEFKTLAPMSISLKTSAPSFVMLKEDGEPMYRLFSTWEEGNEVSAPQHSYALSIHDMPSNKRLFPGRQERWEAKSKADPVTSIWVGGGIKSEGLELFRRDAIILLAGLVHYDSAGASQFTYVAESETLDVKDLRQAWDSVIAAFEAEASLIQTSNAFCKKAS